MNFIDSLVRKGNIFDHLLYEFEMYLETYSRLVALKDEEDDCVFKRNVLLESHAVHMRNIIEFFNCDRYDWLKYIKDLIVEDIAW